MHVEHCFMIPLIDSVTCYPGHGTKMWFLYFSLDVKEIFSLLIFTCLWLGYYVS